MCWRMCWKMWFCHMFARPTPAKHVSLGRSSSEGGIHMKGSLFNAWFWETVQLRFTVRMSDHCWSCVRWFLSILCWTRAGTYLKNDELTTCILIVTPLQRLFLAWHRLKLDFMQRGCICICLCYYFIIVITIIADSMRPPKINMVLSFPQTTKQLGINRYIYVYRLRIFQDD